MSRAAENWRDERARACKHGGMPSNLRDVTSEFYRGEATLEVLRAAALAERIDRQLADGILRLISEWEQNPEKNSTRVRNELRARAKELVPPAPAVSPASTYRRDPSESIYAAGIRGQQRRS